MNVVITSNTIQKLAKDIHEENIRAGWWDAYPNKYDRKETAIMLVITEIAEAVEGWRRDLDDDHLSQYKMYHVEIADALIRLLDVAKAFGLETTADDVDTDNYDWCIASTNKIVPEKLLYIIKNLVQGDWFAIIRAIDLLFQLAIYEQIDILKIIEEKREYNRHRADHKKENRAKKGGKKI